MNTPITFRPAVRQSVKLLIGLLGASGGGKTESALKLGRGIVGPNGKLALADTENGRGELCYDRVPGGYLYLPMNPPFHPLSYCEVIDAAEKAGIDCLCIDSATHEWTGEGGYLDLKEEALERMAGQDWKKREKCAMAAAGQVKPKTHAKFYARVCRSSMTIILCFRGKQKVQMGKGTDGKTTIEKDDHMSAIQDSELIFEMLIAGEVFAVETNGVPVGGYFRTVKYSHPSIPPLLPKAGEQVSVSHGEAISKWARGDSPKNNQIESTPEIKRLKKQLFAMTKGEHDGDQEKFWGFLYNRKVVTNKEFESRQLTEQRLKEAIDHIEGLAN